jgi:aerobic carbon-monoxide dehydrogenase medium subunit
VIPHAFDYVAPDTVAGCVTALADGGRVLAGGTWVLPELGRSESTPDQLVHLRRAGLGGVTALADDGVHIGAMATYADLLASPEVAARAPLLRSMADGITGGWALRNQATVGGSAMAARPQSDAPAALVASNAVARVAGPDGERRLSARDLFAGPMRTSLRAGELLTGFDVPSSTGAGVGYRKLKRGGSSWPIATAAAVVRLDRAGICTAATLVLGGVAGTPLVVDIAAVLVGRVPGAVDLAEAAALAAAALTDPWHDLLAPASYRAAVAGPVARRTLSAALDDARTEQEKAV